MSTRSNLLCVLGYIIGVIAVRSHASMLVAPNLIIPTGFARFCCLSTSDDGNIEPVEWLDSNLDVLTTNGRIRMRRNCIMFYNPLLSDAGSYWCKKVGKTDKTEVKLVIAGYIGTKITVEGSDVFLACPANISANHNNKISWASNYSQHIDFTTNPSYSKNMSGMIIHNITTEHKGYYTCYSEEDGIGYKTKLIIERHPQNQKVVATVSDQVILDCSESSLEYPTYNWSIPDTCTSCPHVNTDSLMMFTADMADSGEYTCEATNQYEKVLITFVVSVTDPKPPELLIEQFQTVTVSSGQQVVLNCTVSSSPDLMYNWSIPYTCSSCPHNNNDSVMIFTADITDNGEYVCKAKNRYGATQITFTVEVLEKPSRNTTTIIKDCQRDNTSLVLTCGIYYPSAVVKWNVMMDSSAMHQTVEESSAGKYIVHDNGSLEVHHRYISDNDHLMFMCLTENQDGSFEHVFHVWNHTAFYQACSVKSVKTDVVVEGRMATVTFSAVPAHPGVKFRCKLNKKNYASCTSPMVYRDLRTRGYRVIVQAACASQSPWISGKAKFKVNGVK